MQVLVVLPGPDDDARGAAVDVEDVDLDHLLRRGAGVPTAPAFGELDQVRLVAPWPEPS